MRLQVLLSTLVLAPLAASLGQSQQRDAILRRDVDKRPLPEVTMAQLSPDMRRRVQALISEAKETKTREDRPQNALSLKTSIYRIPVNSTQHRIYYIRLSGDLACYSDLPGPNCLLAVYDETDEGVSDIVKEIDEGIDVVRRPHLQMPDIAVYERTGRATESVVVYRYNNEEWQRYRCGEIDIRDDPHPVVVADKLCTPQ